jgi:hypothetical protein
MELDDKTRKEVVQLAQEAKSLLEQMEQNRKRTTRITMVFLGISLMAVSAASINMTNSWLPLISDPAIADALKGLLLPSYGIFVLAAIVTAMGLIGEDRLNRWFNKWFPKKEGKEAKE